MPRHGNKDFERKRNFYRLHLDRQKGVRGRKLSRLSDLFDLIKLGRHMGIKTEIEK